MLGCCNYFYTNCRFAVALTGSGDARRDLKSETVAEIEAHFHEMYYYCIKERKFSMIVSIHGSKSDF